MANYYKIGRINWTIAQKAHIKCADIVITDNHIKHVQNEHKRELAQLNISAIDYIQLVVNNYDEIIRRRDNGVMLIKTNIVPPHDTCVVELSFEKKKQLWFVKTAEPRKKIQRTDKDGENLVLWKKRGCTTLRTL